MRTLWSSRATASPSVPSCGWVVTSDPSWASWFGSRSRQHCHRTYTKHIQQKSYRTRGKLWQYLPSLTLAGILAVLGELSYLPVQVGVPGPQLDAVQRLDVEIWPLNLQDGDNKAHVNTSAGAGGQMKYRLCLIYATTKWWNYLRWDSLCPLSLSVNKLAANSNCQLLMTWENWIHVIIRLQLIQIFCGRAISVCVCV